MRPRRRRAPGLRRRGKIIAGTVLAVGCQALLPVAADAHGIGGVQGLPIPTWLFAWAASIVLVVSFVALATLWPRARFARPRQRVLSSFPQGFEPLGGAIGIVLLGLVIYAGFAGEQDEPTANLAPVMIFVLFWVGLPLLSFLIGDVFRWLNPWRALARGASTLGRRAGLRLRAPLAYPRRWGRWPAVGGIFAFVWVELVDPARERPAHLALLALLCCLAQLLAMACFGIEEWEQRGDPFAVYFGLFARLSPLRWQRGKLILRRPLEGVTTLEALAGTTALLAVMIGSTSFDGLSQSPAWTELLPSLQRHLHSVGLSGQASLEMVQTAGLLVMTGLVAGIYRLGVLGMKSIASRHSTAELSRRFVHTLVPIALAYVIAHYFTFLVFQGQSIGALISDPLGHGSNIFGTAHASIDYGLISASKAWYFEVAALLAGHVAGLVLAHDRAVAMFEPGWDPAGVRIGSDGTLILDARVNTATQSQYWMLGVMVAFTCLGLWILSAAA